MKKILIFLVVIIFSLFTITCCAKTSSEIKEEIIIFKEYNENIYYLDKNDALWIKFNNEFPHFFKVMNNVKKFEGLYILDNEGNLFQIPTKLKILGLDWTEEEVDYFSELKKISSGVRDFYVTDKLFYIKDDNSLWVEGRKIDEDTKEIIYGSMYNPFIITIKSNNKVSKVYFEEKNQYGVENTLINFGKIFTNSYSFYIVSKNGDLYDENFNKIEENVKNVYRYNELYILKNDNSLWCSSVASKDYNFYKFQENVKSLSENINGFLYGILKNDGTLIEYNFNKKDYIIADTGVKSLCGPFGYIKYDDSYWKYYQGEKIKLSENVKEVYKEVYNESIILKNDGSLWNIQDKNNEKIGDNIESALKYDNSYIEFVLNKAGEILAFNPSDKYKNDFYGTGNLGTGWGHEEIGFYPLSLKEKNEFYSKDNLKISKDSISKIIPSDKNSYFLTKCQTLYGIGSNAHCQLGTDKYMIYTSPIKISENVKAIFPASTCIFIINNKDELYILGRFLGSIYKTPTKVADNITNVKSKGYFTAILDKKGNLYTLDEGLKLNKYIDNVIKFDIDRYKCLFLKNDHSLWLYQEVPEKIKNSVSNFYLTGYDSNFRDGETDFGKEVFIETLDKKILHYDFYDETFIEDNNIKNITKFARKRFAFTSDNKVYKGFYSSDPLDKEEGFYNISFRLYKNNVKDMQNNNDNYYFLNKNGDLIEGELSFDDFGKDIFKEKIIFNDVNSIYVGFDYVFAIKNDGSIYAKGNNNFGQLGLEELKKYENFEKVKF